MDASPKPDGICNPVRNVLCVEGYRLVYTKRKRRGCKPRRACQTAHCNITLMNALLRCVVAPLRETLFCLSHNFDSNGLVYNGENSHLEMGLLKLQLPEERPSRSL